MNIQTRRNARNERKHNDRVNYALRQLNKQKYCKYKLKGVSDEW